MGVRKSMTVQGFVRMFIFVFEGLYIDKGVSCELHTYLSAWISCYVPITLNNPKGGIKQKKPKLSLLQ